MSQLNDPLFQANNAYLESIQSFLEAEKQKFAEAIEKTFFQPKNNKPPYQAILVEANTKAIEKMDAAIQDICDLRLKLEEAATKAEEIVMKNLPK